VTGENHIRLVCFDLGGVVIRICHTWEEGCAAAGLELRDGIEAIRERTGAARRDLMRQHQTGRLDGPTYASRLSGVLDGLYSPQELMAVHHAWLGDEYPDLGPIVERLHQGGVQTACLSNTNHEHWSRLAEFPTVLQLGRRFVSHELGLRKPDPEIYRTVEQRTGVRGERILFLDDGEENIAAARAVGWNAQTIDPHPPTAPQITAALREHGAV